MAASQRNKTHQMMRGRFLPPKNPEYPGCPEEPRDPKNIFIPCRFPFVLHRLQVSRRPTERTFTVPSLRSGAIRIWNEPAAERHEPQQTYNEPPSRGESLSQIEKDLEVGDISSCIFLHGDHISRVAMSPHSSNRGYCEIF